MNFKDKKNILILILILCCIILSFAYVKFYNELEVNGTLKINNASWSVKFTDVQTTNIVGKATNFKKPVLTSSTVNFYAEFNQLGDSIEYKITIKNDGNIDAKVSGIHFSEDSNEYIEYSLIGIDEETILRQNQSIEVNVILKYSIKLNDNNQKLKNIKMLINWEEYN